MTVYRLCRCPRTVFLCKHQQGNCARLACVTWRFYRSIFTWRTQTCSGAEDSGPVSLGENPSPSALVPVAQHEAVLFLECVLSEPRLLFERTGGELDFTELGCRCDFLLRPDVVLASRLPRQRGCCLHLEYFFRGTTRLRRRLPSGAAAARPSHETCVRAALRPGPRNTLLGGSLGGLVRSKQGEERYYVRPSWRDA